MSRAALPAQLREGFSAEEQGAGYTAHGELVVTHALGDPSLTWRSEATAPGFVTAGDGPYPEAKELLAGFLLVDCASRERAIEIAPASAGLAGPSATGSRPP